jgi:hypothetical protein
MKKKVKYEFPANTKIKVIDKETGDVIIESLKLGRSYCRKSLNLMLAFKLNLNIYRIEVVKI